MLKCVNSCNNHEQEKGKIVTPLPIPDTKLVKYEPATPLEIANKFTTIGSIPIIEAASFSSALNTPYDPYAKASFFYPILPCFKK